MSFVVMASVMVFGLIAASNVTARGAHSEVNPARADPEAILTAVGTGSYIRQLVGNMGAVVGHARSVVGRGPHIPPIIPVM